MGRQALQPKPNRFKQLLAEGKTPIGHMLFEFHTRGMAQLLAASGVDFVVIDMEHSSFTVSDTADLIAWLKATPVAPFVRVPEVQYHHIARVMDAGAMGVVAPNVQSAAQARALVDAAKSVPIGERGFFHGGANSDFRGAPPETFRAFMDQTNENTSVMCLIESPEGVDQLEAIASTPGVDAMWVGYADLAQYMGIPGQFHDDRFLAAVKRTAQVARRHGLAAIIQPGNPTQLREWLALGFNAISYGADCFLYRDALTKAVEDARKAVEERESVG